MVQRGQNIMQPLSVVRGFVPTIVTAIATLMLASPPTMANPSITALFDPAANGGAGFSAADMATIENALSFYATNITSTVSVTVDFTTQTAGGASTVQGYYNGLSYSDYYSALASNASLTGNAVQVSAVGSLPNTTNNPVTGSSGVTMSTTLASLFGLASQSNDPQANCGVLSGAACIEIGLDELGQPSLLGTVQHEFDEVLGTSSALSIGNQTPTDPTAADLFRYASPDVRSFAANSDTSEPCGGPTAYFSVNGGITNINSYNNCNNGGDYGDWASGAIPQVQDAFGDPSDFTSLSLASPEIALLEAVGYDFVSPTSTPEPATIGLLLVGAAGLWRTRRGRIIHAG